MLGWAHSQTQKIVCLREGEHRLFVLCNIIGWNFSFIVFIFFFTPNQLLRHIHEQFIILAHFSLFPFFVELAFLTLTLLLSSGLDRLTAEIRRIYNFPSPYFLPHLPVLLWLPLQQLSGLTSCPLVRHAGQSVPPQRLCHRGSSSHLRHSGRPSVFAGCRVTFMFLLRHLLNVLTGWRLCSGENGWKRNHGKTDVLVNIN